MSAEKEREPMELRDALQLAQRLVSDLCYGSLELHEAQRVAQRIDVPIQQALLSKAPSVPEQPKSPDSGEKDASTAATVPIPMELIQLVRSAKAMLATARYARSALNPHDNLAPTDEEIKLWDQDVELAEKALLSSSATSGASATDASSEAPIELAMCEISGLILKPNTLYRFTEVPECKACREYSSPKSLSVAAQASVESERWDKQVSVWRGHSEDSTYEIYCGSQTIAFVVGVTNADKFLSKHRASLLRVAQAVANKDSGELDKIRETVAATGITEDEGSTLGMVISICDYAKHKSGELGAAIGPRDVKVPEMALQEVWSLAAKAQAMRDIPNEHERKLYEAIEALRAGSDPQSINFTPIEVHVPGWEDMSPKTQRAIAEMCATVEKAYRNGWRPEVKVITKEAPSDERQSKSSAAPSVSSPESPPSFSPASGVVQEEEK